MRRRHALHLLATTPLALAGCVATPDRGDSGGTGSPTPTPTESSTPTMSPIPTETSTPEPTPTAEPLPEECPTSPDVEGLPERPADPDTESMTAFVAEYERTLALARNPEYADINYVEHVSTRRVDGGYRIHFFLEPLVATPTPAQNGTNTTATPESVSTYNVGYFVTDRRIVREKRLSAVTYRFSPYDGFDPREDGTLVACGE